MGIAKFFDFGDGIAKFVWVGANMTAFDLPYIMFLTGNNGAVKVEVQGILGGNIIYEEVFEHNSPIFVGGTTAHASRLIVNVVLPVQVDTCVVTVLLYAPISITGLSFPVQYTNLIATDFNGMKEMKNCLTYVANSNASIPIPEAIFTATELTAINVLTVSNVTNIDPRLQGLSHLNILKLGFASSEVIDTDVLLGMPVLSEFFLYVYSRVINDAFMEFSTAFQAHTVLTKLVLGRSGVFSKIPETIANLNLKEFWLQYANLSTTAPNIVNYPLRSGADNTILELLFITGNNQTTANIAQFNNVEKLVALIKIRFLVVYASAAKNTEQLNHIYEMVYSKVYYRPGNTHSDLSLASGYFSTLGVAPTVNTFVHPAFRTIENVDNGLKVVDRVFSNQLLDLRRDGLTAIGSYYTTIRRQGLQLEGNNVDYVLLANPITLASNSNWYVEYEGTLEDIYIGSSSVFNTLAFGDGSGVNDLVFTLRGSVSYFAPQEQPTTTTTFNSTKYAKIRFEFDGAINDELRVYYNHILVFTSQPTIGKGNLVIESIGVRGADGSSPAYPAGANAPYTSTCFMSYLDINGDIYDFNETTGNSITSSLGNLAEIKTKEPTGATYIDTMWQTKDINM